MTNILAVFSVAALCLAVGFNHVQPQDDSDNLSEISKLKKERLRILKDRVDIIDEIVRRGSASAFVLVKPTIDLIRAKIEYANSNDERRILYDQWLEQHDRLIELEEFRGKGPVSTMRTKMELLRLKSDRLKIQIERGSLN